MRRLLTITVFLLFSGTAPAQQSQEKPEESSVPSLHMLGYSHLDTQWLWTYRDTLTAFLPATVDENIDLIHKTPEYLFNFTGSFRYRLLKTHDPARWNRVKKAVQEGRWFLSGSSVDEADLLIPSPESIIRHVLYGRLYFKENFGEEATTHDFLAPDAFGFRAHLPTTLSHAGVIGFTTQKLSWGLAIEKPFHQGHWLGPDGSVLPSAFSPDLYSAEIKVAPHQNEEWLEQLREVAEKTGFPHLLKFIGQGDKGGAPTQASLDRVLESVRQQSQPRVRFTRSDTLFQEWPKDNAHFPSYQGPLLLTEHSAGSLTSNVWSKRWNRALEELAFAAETAAALAYLRHDAVERKRELRRAWELLLATQMHDIIPGTGVPEIYVHSHNDQHLSGLILTQVLEEAIAELGSEVDGEYLVWNPTAHHYEGLIQIPLLPGENRPHACVLDSSGNRLPVQRVPSIRSSREAELLVRLELPPFGMTGLRFTNDTLSCPGPVTKETDAQNLAWELAQESTYELQFEHPDSYPAWNMDWNDRQKPPTLQQESWNVREKFDGPLARGLIRSTPIGASHILERLVHTKGRPFVSRDISLHWSSAGYSLKLRTRLPEVPKHVWADDGVGKVAYPVNHRRLFEFPFYRWIFAPQSQPHAGYSSSTGVGIFSRDKYGFDRPSKHDIRLTLSYAPMTQRGGKTYHQTQDFGMQLIESALGWGTLEETSRTARQFSQRPMVFARQPGSRHPAKFSPAKLGKQTPLPATLQLQAFKILEERNGVLLRLVNTGNVEATFRPLELLEGLLPATRMQKINSVEVCNGQEARLSAHEKNGAVTVRAHGLTSICILFQETQAAVPAQNKDTWKPIPLPRSTSLLATESQHFPHKTCTKSLGSCFRQLEWQDPEFHLQNVATDGLSLLEENPLMMANLEAEIVLPLSPQQNQSTHRELVLFVAPEARTRLKIQAIDSSGEFLEKPQVHPLASWHGPLLQPDTRVWDQLGNVRGISAAFADQAQLAFLGISRQTHPQLFTRSPEASDLHDNLQEGIDPYHRSQVFTVPLVLPPGTAQVLVQGHSTDGSTLISPRLISARERNGKNQRFPFIRLVSDPMGIADFPSPKDSVSGAGIHVSLREQTLSDQQLLQNNTLQAKAANPIDTKTTSSFLCEALQAIDVVLLPDGDVELQAMETETDFFKMVKGEVGWQTDAQLPTSQQACFQFAQPVHWAFVSSQPCLRHRSREWAGSRFFGTVTISSKEPLKWQESLNIDGYQLPAGSAKILTLRSQRTFDQICFASSVTLSPYQIKEVWGQ